MMDTEFAPLSAACGEYETHEANIYESLNCFTTFGSNIDSSSDEDSSNRYEHYQNTDSGAIPYVEQHYMSCPDTEKIVEQLVRESPIQDALSILETDNQHYDNYNQYVPYVSHREHHVNHVQYPEYSVVHYQQPYFTERQTSIPDFSLINNSPHSGSYSEATGEDSEAEEERELQKKRGAKNILLWKFLLEQLQCQQRSIRWINMEDGTFRFIDTTEISKLWGEKKRKSDMNFEKLSRGIRHYYRQGMMTREEGTRLVYRFHWQKIPKKFRRRFVQM